MRTDKFDVDGFIWFMVAQSFRVSEAMELVVAAIDKLPEELFWLSDNGVKIFPKSFELKVKSGHRLMLRMIPGQFMLSESQMYAYIRHVSAVGEELSKKFPKEQIAKVSVRVVSRFGRSF